MGRRGRPRKAGKRTDKDRLSRAGQGPVYIKGNDRIETMRERFGSHYNSALGRAYAGGLLGDGMEAMNRYQAAKRFVSLYRRFIGSDAYRCALNDEPGGNVVDLWPDFETNEKQLSWLMAAMDSMDVAGVRPYFDALISTVNTDSGPFWLDSLLAGSKHPADRMLLQAAIRALDIIAPEVRPIGILAVAS
jgi:hypothetical protein